MAALSHRNGPSPSRTTGTSPLGFMALYSGVSLPPNVPPTSSRSQSSPSSASAHITNCTLPDVARPQTVIMSFSSRKALVGFQRVEVHVVAHVAFRRLPERLEIPREIGAVAQRRIDHPAARLAL